MFQIEDTYPFVGSPARHVCGIDRTRLERSVLAGTSLGCFRLVVAESD